jgi:hypothetical protein
MALDKTGKVQRTKLALGRREGRGLVTWVWKKYSKELEEGRRKSRHGEDRALSMEHADISSLRGTQSRESWGIILEGREGRKGQGQ